MKTPFIIVAYYTVNTLYEMHADVLIKSIKRLNMIYYIEGITDLGGWYKNTGYKPIFIKRMLLRFPKFNIVYIDIDAEFIKYPILFDTLDCNIAVYELDRSDNPRGIGKTEVLSGTIFLKNNSYILDLVKRWEIRCKEKPKSLDQRVLRKVLCGNYYKLPGEYCKIFDRMNDVVDPVIVQYQASRKIKRNKNKIEER